MPRVEESTSQVLYTQTRLNSLKMIVIRHKPLLDRLRMSSIPWTVVTHTGSTEVFRAPLSFVNNRAHSLAWCDNQFHDQHPRPSHPLRPNCRQVCSVRGRPAAAPRAAPCLPLAQAREPRQLHPQQLPRQPRGVTGVMELRRSSWQFSSDPRRAEPSSAHKTTIRASAR